MVKVLLVRHAEAIVTGLAPPSEWELSPSGVKGAGVLGRRLAGLVDDGLAALYTSAERKAVQTATLLGVGDAIVDERLGEVKKPWYDSPQDHEAAAIHYLSGHDVRGWERREEASQRFDAAVRDFGDELAVCATHGTVMSLWLSHRVQSFDPIEFWRGLSFPDAHLVVSSRDGFAVSQVA